MGTKTPHGKRRSDSRERLLLAADELFQRRGFEDTTLEAIAEHAGLHVQTLYRYFPRKHDLLSAMLFKNLDEFKDYMRTRTKSALQTWRDWVELNARRMESRERFDRPAPPETAEYWHGYEAELAHAVAEDLDVAASHDLRPLLIACMLVGANKHTAWELAASGRTRNWVADLLAVVDKAVETVGHHLEGKSGPDHGSD